MSTTGLTTEEANMILLDHIRKKTAEYEEKTKKSIFNHLYHLIAPGNISCLISLTALCIDFKSNLCLIVALIPWFTTNIIVEIILYNTEIRRKASRLYVAMEEFVDSIKEKTSTHHVELNQPIYLLDPPSSSLIPIFRDSTWKRLPQNVIVPGDIFKNPQGHPLPCDVQNLSDTPVNTNYKPLLPDIVGQETSINLCYETWISAGYGCDAQLHAFLESVETKEPVRSKNKAVWDISDSSVFIHLNHWWIFTIGILAAFFLFFISYFIYNTFPNRPDTRTYTIFSSTILLFSSPIKDALIRWIKVWGNVKLQSLFEWHHESRFMGEMDPESSHDSTFESSSSLDSVDSDMAASQIPLFRQLKELFSVFIKGFDGQDSLLNTLSSVTLLCFLDDIGILSEASAKPVEIAIPFKYKKEKLSRTNIDKKNVNAKRKLSDDNSTSDYNTATDTSKSIAYHTDLVILDVTQSTNENIPGNLYIRFANEIEKKTEPLLRPICLAASFTQIPRYKIRSLYTLPSNIEDAYFGSFANTCTLNPFNDCKCGLASGMNLSKNYIRKFRILRTIILIDHMAKNTKQFEGALIFFIVKDLKCNTMQLFVKGSPSLLFDFKSPMQFLANMDSLYDMNILTRSLKRKLRNLNMQWISSGMHPIAYAYKPLSFSEASIFINTLPPISIFCISSLLPINKNIWFRESMRHSRPEFLQLSKISDFDMLFTRHFMRNEWINTFKKCNLESKLPLIFGKEAKNQNDKKSGRSSAGGTPAPLLCGPWSTPSSEDISDEEENYREDLADDNVESPLHLDLSPVKFPTQTSPSSGLIDSKGGLVSGWESLPRTSRSTARDSYHGGLGFQLIPFHDPAPAEVVEPFIGELLCKSLDNICFLGMFATKLQCPREVPIRIQNLHQAGIRMVNFSKQDEKGTKKLGSMLGLETNWNCMISLSESRTATLVNRDGNVVLPSGIENIRKHIKEIDDIPLKVSLFFNCTIRNIIQMMNILRENGETIMCIGSGLKYLNFFIFQAADISLSISLGYHPICRFCKGLRWRGFARAHIFDPIPPEFKVSSSLTSLPCALKTEQFHKVSDPYFVMEMLYEVFNEARRLDSNIQQTVGFITTSFWSLLLFFVFEIALQTPPIIKHSDFAILLSFYIPLLSISLMASPSSDSTMEMMPSRDIKHGLIFPIKLLYRIVPNTLFLCIFFIYHLWDSQSRALDNSSPYNIFTACRHECMEKVNALVKEKASKGQVDLFVITQEFTILFFTLYLVLSSHSWINRYEGMLTTGPFSNMKWMIASLVVLSIQSVRMYFNIRKYTIFISKYAIMIASFWVIILILVDELFKVRERNRKQSEQKYLRLLFSTRLGMWSPK